MPHRLVIFAAALVAWVPAVGPALAQTQGDWPALPADYLAAPIQQARQKIAACDRQIASAADADQLLLAERNLWRITATLLEAGQAGGNASAVASLYGLTLAGHVDQFEPTVRPMMQAARNALNRNDHQGLARMTRIAHALRSFNARCDTWIGALPDGSGPSVDRYLSHLLSPLATLAAVLEQPAPADTWITEDWRQPDLKPAAALKALAERIHQTDALGKSARQALQADVAMMQQGLKLTALQPRIVGLYRQVTTLIDLAERFSAASQLGPDGGSVVRRRVDRIAEQLSDPARREQAVRQIHQLERDAEIFDRLNRLQAAEVSVASAYPLLDLLLDQPDDAPNSAAIADLLETMTAASTDYRAIKSQVLPLDIRRTFSLLCRRFERLEETTYVSLKLLRHDPASVSDVRWVDPISQMSRTVARLRLINQIPEWMARVKAINPAAGAGLYKQLRASATDLLKPENAEKATAALREMQKQLALFERLPYENQLNQPDSVIGQWVGDQAGPINQQIIRQRSLWAAAWNVGEDPTVAGGRLLLLRRLLVCLHEGDGLVEAGPALEQLNRWAGWEIDPDHIGPMIAGLPGLLKTAAAAAATGNWNSLSTSLDELDRQIRIPRLMNRLIRGIGPGLTELPGGLSGMIGQCLYPPAPGAFGVAQRQQLAQLCACIEASLAARRNDRNTTADQLWQTSGRIAQTILDQWASPPQQIHRATPTQPSPPPTAPVDV